MNEIEGLITIEQHLLNAATLVENAHNFLRANYKLELDRTLRLALHNLHEADRKNRLFMNLMGPMA